MLMIGWLPNSSTIKLYDVAIETKVATNKFEILSGY